MLVLSCYPEIETGQLYSLKNGNRSINSIRQGHIHLYFFRKNIKRHLKILVILKIYLGWLLHWHNDALPSIMSFISRASLTQAELGTNEATLPPVPWETRQLSGVLPAAMSLMVLHQECASCIYKKVVTMFKPWSKFQTGPCLWINK